MGVIVIGSWGSSPKKPQRWIRQCRQLSMIPDWLCIYNQHPGFYIYQCDKNLSGFTVTHNHLILYVLNNASVGGNWRAIGTSGRTSGLAGLSLGYIGRQNELLSE
ncbi:hypothetical protein DAI22_12g169000 [Oryza sativa Japonica Group]|nr:hypothetical protein DAI22_12g169000 [Oryza sativa Japonica Group]